MKKTFKKIAATLSAAVMCAIPMASALSANAAAGPNARCTMRKIYWIDSTAYVKKINVGFTNVREGCSPATITAIAAGTPSFGGSAGDVYYNCGGTLTANGSDYIKGAAVSFSVLCNSPSCYEQGRNVYCYAYKAGGVQSYNSVHTVDAFLVGDINKDGYVNGSDSGILNTGLCQNAFTNVSYDGVVTINSKNYYYYTFDIDDNGVVNEDDLTMLRNYESSSTYTFER